MNFHDAQICFLCPSAPFLSHLHLCAGDGQRRAETAEERSHPGGHQGAPNGQNWWHLHRPAAVRQVQEEELHLQPGKHTLCMNNHKPTRAPLAMFYSIPPHFKIFLR